MNLTELSAAIAATGNAWILPGVAVRDPVTSEQWRCSGSLFERVQWVCIDRQQGLIIQAEPMMGASVSRALAAGPDLTDAVTALSLLAGMPDAVLCNSMEWSEDDDDWLTTWAVNPESRADDEQWRPTRAEAIAIAYLAAHAKAPTT